MGEITWRRSSGRGGENSISSTNFGDTATITLFALNSASVSLSPARISAEIWLCAMAQTGVSKNSFAPRASNLGRSFAKIWPVPPMILSCCAPFSVYKLTSIMEFQRKINKQDVNMYIKEKRKREEQRNVVKLPLLSW